jgi:hypothetical protein
VLHQRCNTVEGRNKRISGAGRRDVASLWKGGVKERVRVASTMHHYGAGQVGEMLHHRGTRRAKSECVLHQRCNTMELDM